MKSIEEFNAELIPFVSEWEERELRIATHPDSDEILVRREKGFIGETAMSFQHDHGLLLDELWVDFEIEYSGQVLILRDSQKLLVATEYVQGTRLDKAVEQGQPGALEALVDLYSNLTNYFKFKLTSDTEHLTDIELPYQYMYDPEKKAAILVDIDCAVNGIAGSGDCALELLTLYGSIYEDTKKYSIPKEILENIVQVITSVDITTIEAPYSRRAMRLLQKIAKEGRVISEEDYEAMF
jgi:hypothetical protein